MSIWLRGPSRFPVVLSLVTGPVSLPRCAQYKSSSAFCQVRSRIFAALCAFSVSVLTVSAPAPCLTGCGAACVKLDRRARLFSLFSRSLFLSVALSSLRRRIRLSAAASMRRSLPARSIGAASARRHFFLLLYASLCQCFSRCGLRWSASCSAICVLLRACASPELFWVGSELLDLLLSGVLLNFCQNILSNLNALKSCENITKLLENANSKEFCYQL